MERTRPILGPGEFYGKRFQTYEVAGGRFAETVYSPSFTIPPHAHEGAFFGFVLEGGYRETYERKNRECIPSTLLFHPEGEVHSEAHYDTVVRIFSIEPTPAVLELIRERCGLLKQPMDVHGGPLVALSTRLYREFRAQDALAPLAMEGLLLEILVAACRLKTDSATSVAPQWLRQAKDLIHDQSAQNLSLADIAQSVGVHPAHLARTFRQHFHCTVGEYVRNLRMERARRELSTTDISLSVLALTLGYSDQSHFATAFRRHTGIAPGQFRKMARQR